MNHQVLICIEQRLYLISILKKHFFQMEQGKFMSVRILSQESLYRKQMRMLIVEK